MFESAWLTPRTANYVAALIRDGDNFNYCKWLQKVREEKAQAKEHPRAVFRRNVPEEIKTRVDCREASLNGRLFNGRGSIPTRMTRSRRKALHSTSITRITRRLEKVHDAWNEFQANRARRRVWLPKQCVCDCRALQSATKDQEASAARVRIFQAPFDKKADPFSAVIR
jgi:hypothetical protein